MIDIKEKEERDKKRLQEYLDRSLDYEEEFNFACMMCGNCCRKRKDPIGLTGYDLYNIAKSLRVNIEDLFEKCVRVEVEPSFPIPRVYLNERDDGSCRLLRKGKCTIQKDKPVVCRNFPLGRMFYKDKFYYFTQDDTCAGTGQNKIKLRVVCQIRTTIYNDRFSLSLC